MLKDKVRKVKRRLENKKYAATKEENYPKMLKKWYDSSTGEDLDFKNIENFNQYIQYSKIYNTTAEKRELSDKYRMRDFVKNNLGEKYLPRLYGVYKQFEDVDFENLPKSFVLKCNHGSGMNAIVKDKSKVDKKELKKEFSHWLKMNYAFCGMGLELQYKEIKPVIICEEYLGDNLVDIQFWCSYGEVLFISYIKSPHGENKKVSFSAKWEQLDFVTSLPRLEEKVARPKQLEEMLDIAKKVSRNMKFIRLDFYILDDGSVKISEFTFTPANGLVGWQPSEMNEKIYEQMMDIAKKRGANE
ncbi:hypothetical protein IKG73_01295 [Candidatus Saccharibacteria bacterium]|nr:hypothetical protein [Candidatus Saccharibacteria bacterium]